MDLSGTLNRINRFRIKRNLSGFTDGRTEKVITLIDGTIRVTKSLRRKI
jgi:hypothetical protein